MAGTGCGWEDLAGEPLRGYVLARLPAASYVSHYSGLAWDGSQARRSTLFDAQCGNGAAFRPLFVLNRVSAVAPQTGVAGISGPRVDWLSPVVSPDFRRTTMTHSFSLVVKSARSAQRPVADSPQLG